LLPSSPVGTGGLRQRGGGGQQEEGRQQREGGQQEEGEQRELINDKNGNHDEEEK
jgi:hypothetical protein